MANSELPIRCNYCGFRPEPAEAEATRQCGACGQRDAWNSMPKLRSFNHRAHPFMTLDMIEKTGAYFG